MRIRKEHTAGLIIDIQEKLFPVMLGKEELISNCRKLVKGLQILGIPLLVTQQYTRGLGATLPEISSLIPEFNHIEKRDFSCCGETAAGISPPRLPQSLCDEHHAAESYKG